MHSFDSLARSMVKPAQPTRRRRPLQRRGSMLAWAVPLCCALMPLGVMIEAYITTI